MDILPQILLLALISSAVYALLATGLTLTFGTMEIINFAHGDMAMAGAFIFYTVYVVLGVPLAFSILLTILLSGIVGFIIEKTTFRPVRDKQEFIPLILSIGVAIIIISTVTMFYGGGSRTYFESGQVSPVYTFFDGTLTITLVQIAIITSAIVLLTALYLFLQKTKTGKAIRAVSDDKEVAAIMGINVNRMISLLFIMATSLAGFAGILVAFDQNLYPSMGLPLSIKVFAAIILGGVGKFHGAIVGALIIGFSENLLVGLTPIKASYKELLAFIIIITILLIKPYGLFGGKKEEIESR